MIIFDAASKAAQISEHLEALLTENHFHFSCQINNYRYKKVFSILRESHETGGLLEHRILLYVGILPLLVAVEGTIPFVCGSLERMEELVNQLNLDYPLGTFRVDPSNGEPRWTRRLPTYMNKAPSDALVLEAIADADKMIDLLYQELVKQDIVSSTKEETL